MSYTIAMGSDVLVEWAEPIDETDGSFIGIDATGTVTLKTTAGVAVTGADALAMTYDAGPPRRYYATIPYTVSLTAGTTYHIDTVLYASGGTPRGTRREVVVAAYET
jgi:hypothetical protein